MAKIIVTTRYYKGNRIQGTGKLLKYIATREGVEKLDTNAEHKPSTKQQDAFGTIPIYISIPSLIHT